jgi:tetratricopeptide (TPR) repeat protein
MTTGKTGSRSLTSDAGSGRNRRVLRRRTLLGSAIAICGCRRQLPQPVTELLKLQDGLGDQPAELSRARDVLFELESAVRSRTNARDETTVDAINDVVFERFGFEREITSTDLRYVFLGEVLLARRGSCVGLGSVYFSLGQLLTLPLDGVVLPGHFYLRQPGSVPRNIETLRRGEALPDSWYQARYPVLPGMGQAYGRSLGGVQLRGVVAFNVGNERSRQGRLPEAEHAFAYAVSCFDDFAEAHASLGRARHVLGKLEGAERAYAEAYKLAPALPGLTHNQALLNAEVQKKVP